MASTQLLTAINLRTYPLGENDKLVVVFSRERGILRLAARGARKTGNRWAGRLEPLARNSLQVSRGRGSLEVLTSADTRVSGAALMGDYDRLMTGLWLAEVTRALLPEGEPHPEVFDGCETALDLLMERISPATVGLWYGLFILDAAGYRPELEVCVTCQAPVHVETGTVAFSASGDGIRCGRCASPAISVSALAIRLLGALQDADPARLRGANAPSEIASEAGGLLARIIEAKARVDLEAFGLLSGGLGGSRSPSGPIPDRPPAGTPRMPEGPGAW